MDCVQKTAIDQEKYEAGKLDPAAGAATYKALRKLGLPDPDLKNIFRILDECQGDLGGLVEQVVKLDGLPEQADRLIRQVRKSDPRIQASFVKLADIAKQLERIERKVNETHDVVVDIQSRVGQVEVRSEEMVAVTVSTNAKIDETNSRLDQLMKMFGDLRQRETRPKDAASIRNDRELKAVQSFLSDFRAKPQEVQNKYLNDVGKLEMVVGDFRSAERHFQQAANVAGDRKAKAEAHYNAYRAALENRQWDSALQEIRSAVELNQRFAPFNFKDYFPKQILGAGGFGVAYLCTHNRLKGDVVVKTLISDDLDRDIKDVLAEAQTMFQLSHPAIIHVKDCSKEDEPPYFVMEFFKDSTTLEEYIEEHGALSPQEVSEIARQMAKGLQAAHAMDVLHRDVKPANVLVRKSDDKWEVKLIDFGLAIKHNVASNSAASTIKRSKTLSGVSIAGTEDYGAPEQMGKLPGVAVGPPADIYGFGKTCGYALFKKKNPKRKDFDSLPPEFEDFGKLLEECTEEAPDERPQDFSAVLERIPGGAVPGEVAIANFLLAGSPEPAAAPAPPPPPEKEKIECPFCSELILATARICKHCNKAVRHSPDDTAPARPRPRPSDYDQEDEDYGPRGGGRQNSKRPEPRMEPAPTPHTQNPLVILPLCLFCFPVGLTLVWANPRWSSQAKKFWTALTIGVLLIAAIFQGFKTPQTAGPQAQQKSPASDTSPGSQPPSSTKPSGPQPKPLLEKAVDDVTGHYQGTLTVLPNRVFHVEMRIKQDGKNIKGTRRVADLKDLNSFADLVIKGETDGRTISFEDIKTELERNFSPLKSKGKLNLTGSADSLGLEGAWQLADGPGASGSMTLKKTDKPAEYDTIRIDKKLLDTGNPNLTVTLDAIEFRTDDHVMRWRFTFLNKTGETVYRRVGVNNTDNYVTDQNNNSYPAQADSQVGTNKSVTGSLTLKQGITNYWIDFKEPLPDAKMVIGYFSGMAPIAANVDKRGKQPVDKIIRIDAAVPSLQAKLSINLQRIVVMPEGRMRWEFLFVNDTGERVFYNVGINSDNFVTDQRNNARAAVADSQVGINKTASGSLTLPQGAKTSYWIEFEGPDPTANELRARFTRIPAFAVRLQNMIGSLGEQSAGEIVALPNNKK